ncbi:MAG: methionyl-tRNA formyltransferase [Phycisphaerae bacterium]
MKVIFLGSGAFGLPALKTLLHNGHEVALVVTQPDKPAGRGRHNTATPIADFAAKNNLPLRKTPDLNAPEVVSDIKARAPDILVVIAFGQKIADTILRSVPHGGINLHASLLPAFRGAAPIQRAILSGEHSTGVSIIRISKVMDGGEILAQTPTPIGESETAGELHDRLAELGAPLLNAVLQRLAQGDIHAVLQDSTRISQAPKIFKEMAWVDFSKPAKQVSCRIRGLSPWPGCLVDLLTPDAMVRARVSLLKCRDISRIGQAAEPGLVLPDLQIACGGGSIEIMALQPLGKRIMDMRSFANGYGIRAGWKLRSNQPPLRDRF